VLKAVTFYINRLISSTDGIKVLLLDTETVSFARESDCPAHACELLQTPIISLACTTSHLLSQEVYLTDRLDNANREEMPQLKCLVFVRPSADSLEALERELERPRYGQYWLCGCHRPTCHSRVTRFASLHQCPQEVVHRTAGSSRRE
jgi:vacuolar protein sorting-associated protein 45